MKAQIEQDLESVEEILRTLANGTILYEYDVDQMRSLWARVASYLKIAKPLLRAMRSPDLNSGEED